MNPIGGFEVSRQGDAQYGFGLYQILFSCARKERIRVGRGEGLKPDVNASPKFSNLVYGIFSFQQSIAYEEDMFYSITFPPQSHAIALHYNH